MKLPPWLADTWSVLAKSLAAQRLHHALLFAAPAGMGKRALANALAAAALCTQRDADGYACGTCRGCLLVAAGSHPDRVWVTFGLRDDGKPRTEIIVDQMRALSQRLALSSQFGGLQIALIDPADRMNTAAANALLKTLEEPAASTVIMLVADDPTCLPATIRSRCQRIDIPVPARDQALAWLRTQHIDPATANATLEASLGNPGIALDWAGDDTLAVRTACADDLAALVHGRRTPVAVADRWIADRPAARLWFASALAHDEARRLARGESGALGLTAREEIPKLAAWSGRVDHARSLLATTLRPELVVLDVLRAWSRSHDTE